MIFLVAADYRSAFPELPAFTAINDIYSTALCRGWGGGHNGGVVRGEQWLDNPPTVCVDISPTQAVGPHTTADAANAAEKPRSNLAAFSLMLR